MMIKGRLKGAGCFSDDLSVLFVLHLFAKLAAQDFADIGLGQFVTELDVFRHFYKLSARYGEFMSFFFGQARVFFDDEDFEGFACFFVGHADTGDFHDFIVVRNDLLRFRSDKH